MSSRILVARKEENELVIWCTRTLSVSSQLVMIESSDCAISLSTFYLVLCCLSRSQSMGSRTPVTGLSSRGVEMSPVGVGSVAC